MQPYLGSVMGVISPSRAAWIAGLIEGDGYFVKNSTPANQANMGIVVHKADEDVVRRAHEWSGVGRVSGPHQQRSNPTWRWSVVRAEDVLEIAGMIRPLLGARRREQLDAMLRNWVELDIKRRSNTLPLLDAARRLLES